MVFVFVFVEAEAQPLHLKGPKTGICLSYILTSYLVNVHFNILHTIYAGVFRSEICDPFLIFLKFSSVFTFHLNNITTKNLCNNIVFSTAHNSLLVTMCMDFLDGIWGNIEAVD